MVAIWLWLVVEAIVVVVMVAWLALWFKVVVVTVVEM